ncbi:MAG: hypothetical protein JSU72_19975 [Deltaproteobacteria bacterium]|nr:MAG: hypothetical protein JSU72_19975 [Deltaproteobacteria bacterium]
METVQAQRDRKVYALGKEFVLDLGVVTPETLEEHLSHSGDERPDSTLAGIYRHLLGSAQSPNMSPNVIGQAIGGIDKLDAVLGGFEPTAVMEKYGSNWEAVLGDIITQLRPQGKIRRSPRSLWPRFCKTITSGAEFLAQFKDASDFYEWVDLFDQDDRVRPALPMLLSYEIDGFGFPVACDFLMVLGYSNFAKPDVHLKKIFVALGLCSSEDDYQIFRAVLRVARNVGVTPYNVDQVFWLIGSGNFHFVGVKIDRNRDKFIEYAKEYLQTQD